MSPARIVRRGVKALLRRVVAIAVCITAWGATFTLNGWTAVSSGANPSDQIKASASALADASRLYSEAQELYRKGTYEKAQALGERALQLREQALGAENPEVASALTLLGRIADGKNDYAHGAALFHRALAINEKSLGKDDLAVAEVLDGQARNLTATAQFSEAEEAGKRSLQIREAKAGPNDFLVTQALETLSNLYVERAEFGKAESVANRALEITTHLYGADDVRTADAESMLGRIAVRQYNFARGEELLTHASKIKLAAGGEDSLMYAECVADLSLLYLLKRDNVRAEQLAAQAQSMEEKLLGPNHLKVAAILHVRGLIAYRRRDFTTAENFYQRSLAIKEKALGPVHPWLAVTLNNLGLLYWRQEHNYKKAAGYFQRAEVIFEKFDGPESVPVAESLTNLGIMAKNMSDYKSAEEDYKHALAIIEKRSAPNSNSLEVVVESLGILYRDQHDFAKAEPWFLRALQITQDSLGPEHPEAGRILRNLAHLYSAAGNPARARECWQQAIAIEEKDLPLNLALGSERQKLAYFDPYIETLDTVISFQLLQDPENADSRELAATMLLQRKGRILDAMAGNMEGLRNRSNVEDRALLDRLKEVTSKLANLVLNGPGKSSLADHLQQIKTLTEQRDALENEIGKRSSGYYQSSTPVSLAAVKGVLPADAALVEFAVYQPYDPMQPLESDTEYGDPRYVAYVITGAGVQSRDLGDAKTIDAAVATLRKSLRDPESRNIKEAARAVDEKIMRPIRAMARDGRHFLIAPDGQLDLIPFDALVDETGHYLVERYLFTYLSTGRDLLRLQAPRASKTSVMVFADPDFGEPRSPERGAATNQVQPVSRSISQGKDSDIYFAPLDGTKREAQAIQSLFPKAQLLTGAQAIKAALLKLEAPSILHIATHGFFLPDRHADPAGSSGAAATSDDLRGGSTDEDTDNPLLRSGLALTGANLNRRGGDSGILTALEAANLNLWGTKLVTLSACDTGIGEVHEREGVYGLRRAFVLSGAESLVMSLWPVSDYVTREMITTYYTGLKNGRGRGEALRQAELAVLKRKGYEHPFYWASFIESGEWANLSGRR
ncbi:MAG TPA: CHAT domain-containing tetratricopeptide repeat protein [Candidatus Angelobacter sp.]|nr:CHAT domain-containing tetratricopeptide repeat protein [Candidatus Angelobacter sp.]